MKKSSAAVELGRKGGRKRAKSMTAERRREIAQAAGIASGKKRRESLIADAFKSREGTALLRSIDKAVVMGRPLKSTKHPKGLVAQAKENKKAAPKRGPSSSR